MENNAVTIAAFARKDDPGLLALIEYRRNGYVFPEWYEQINKEWREDFIQSMEYIHAFSEEFKFLQHAES